MAYEDAVLALSPDSYWKLDEASAAGGAVDEIGAANGTYDGSGITYSEPKLVPTDTGTSIKTDDTVGGAVNVTDIYDFAGTTSFTALGWGKLETFNAGNGHFFISKRSGAVNGWAFALNAPAVTLTATRIGSSVFNERTFLVAEGTIEGNAHMFGIQYDGTNLSVIYDGTLQDTAASAVSITGHAVALAIGKFNDGGGSTWDGWIDEVAIWTPSLTTQNIADLYDAGITEIEAISGRIYKRFYGPTALPTSATTLYTVPTGARATIRNVYVNNPTAGEVEVTLSIGTDAAGTRILDQHPVAAGATFASRRPTHHTIAAGEVIQGFSDTAGVVVVLDGSLVSV